TPCDADGVLDAGETGVLRVTIANLGPSPTAAFSATVASNSGTSTIAFTGGNALAFGPIAAGATRTATLAVSRTTTTGTEPRAGLVLTFPAGTSRTTTYDARVAYDVAVAASTTDSFATRKSSLTRLRDGNVEPFVPTSEELAHLEDGPGSGEVVLVTPPLEVT